MMQRCNFFFSLEAHLVMPYTILLKIYLDTQADLLSVCAILFQPLL